MFKLSDYLALKKAFKAIDNCANDVNGERLTLRREKKRVSRKSPRTMLKKKQCDRRAQYNIQKSEHVVNFPCVQHY